MDERLSVPKDLIPYARAYESLGDAVTISDAEDRLVFINSAGEELYGYGRNELLGGPLSSIFPAEARFVGTATLLETPNEKWEGEVTRARKSGEEFPAQLTVTLLRNQDDMVIGTAGIVRDLTEVRLVETELRDSRDQLSDIFTVAEDAIIFLDRLQRVTAFNRGAERIFGYRPEEVLGKPIDVLIPERLREEHHAHVEEFAGSPMVGRRMGQRETPILGRRKNGAEFQAEASISKIDSRDGLVFTVILRDISSRKRADDEIKKLSIEQTAIAEIGRIISSTPNADEVFELCAEHVHQLISFDRMVVNKVDTAAATLVSLYESGGRISGWEPGKLRTYVDTPTEFVTRTRTGLILGSEPDDEIIKRFPNQAASIASGLRWLLVVPMFSENEVIGSLHLRSSEEHAYSERDLAVATRIANQMSGAIANSQFYTQLPDAESKQRRLAGENATLAEIGRIITSSLAIDVVYERCEEKIRRLIPSDRVAINLVDVDSDMLTSPYVSGMDIPDQPLRPSMPLEGTFTAAAMRHGLMVRLDEAPDLETSYPGLAAGLKAGLKSFLGVPLRSRDEVIGALLLDSVDPDAYDNGSLDLAQRVADQMSGAIANARLHAQLQFEANERETLANIGRIISSTLDIEEVYERFASEVGKLISSDRIGIGIPDSAREYNTVAYMSGLEVRGRKRGDRLAMEGTLAQQVAQSTSTVLIQDVTREHLEVHVPGLVSDFDQGLRSFLSVPLMNHDRLAGVLQIFSKQTSAYAERHVALAEHVGTQIAGAVANSLLYAQLQDAESEQRRLAEEQTILAEIGRTVSSSLDLEAVYERCAEKIMELIPCDQVAVNLVDDTDESVVNAYVSGMNVPLHFRVSIPLEGTFTAAAMGGGIIMRLGEVPDLRTRYPGAVAALERGIKTSLGAPLRSRDKVIGVLILQSVDPNAYDEGSLDLSQRVADQMSGAIANAELHAAVRQAAHESEVLARVSRAVSSSIDLNDILDLYAAAVGEIIPVDSAGIGLIDHESQTVTPRHLTVNSEIDLPTRDGRVAFPLEGSLSGEVVKRGAVVAVRAETESQLTEKTSRLLRGYRSGIRSFLAVPVWAGDQVTAVIHFSTADPDAYGPNEVAFAEKVAIQISGAVAIARLYADLETRDSQLQGSEERNRAIVQTIPDLIFRVRADGTFLDFQGARDEFAYPPEVWLGKPLSAVMPPDVAELAMRRINRAILTGQVQEFEYTLPVPMPDGEVRDWESRTVRAGDDEVLILARDITERKRLSAELLQAQKMEAVGTLAGGVAHDFNNMLTAITGYTDLAKAALGPDSPVGGYHDEVGKAADRAAGLTRQLLAFSRRQVVNPKVIDLNDIILDMDKMLRRLIREDIELVTLPSENLRLVQADPGHVEQVLMNLAVNASDAMPEGGKLFIETANVDVDDELATHHADLAPGDYVCLTVRDTGEGMTEEVRSRVFEPFFTTKEVGKGTGLGLSTVYGIISQVRGAITVESEQGVGTTFRVLLPATIDEKEDLPLRDDGGFLPTGTETILLVEDEPLVRGVGAEVLRHQGYTVIEAANGVEALEAALNADQTIDMLVTDVVMPLMGGKELADRLRESQPEIKVLYSTGYTEDIALIREVAADEKSLLHKPFGPAELAERVRKSLDGS